MADYRPLAGNTPDLARYVLASLEWEVEHALPIVAKFAQSLIDELVERGYVVPAVWWAVRDTKDGSFAAKNLPSKPAALARRRELGGNSARYRVEPVHPVAPPEQP